MALPPSSSVTLSQALTRKRANPLPLLALGIGVIALIGLALLGFMESQKVEPVVVLVRDVPFGQQLVAEDLTTIQLPIHRPVAVQGIASPQAVIGRYAARNLGSNDVVQPTMLLTEPPTQPVYPNGKILQPNMVPVPFSITTIGPITDRDVVNIGFIDPTGAPDLCDQTRPAQNDQRPSTVAVSGGQPPTRPFACRMLSNVRVLWINEAEGIAYLELTPYQAHTIWALQAAGLTLWGERYGAGSDPLPALDRLDIGQVTREDLLRPAPTPLPAREAGGGGQPVGAPSIPGATGQIPGSPDAGSIPGYAPPDAPDAQP